MSPEAVSSEDINEEKLPVENDIQIEEIEGNLFTL
jgi:hypothetical protein